MFSRGYLCKRFFRPVDGEPLFILSSLTFLHKSSRLLPMSPNPMRFFKLSLKNARSDVTSLKYETHLVTQFTAFCFVCPNCQTIHCSSMERWRFSLGTVPWDTSWQLRRDLNVIRTNRSDTLRRLVNYFLSLMTRGCHWLRIRVRHLSRKESSFPAEMSLIKSVGAASRQSSATPRKFEAMYHRNTKIRMRSYEREYLPMLWATIVANS